MEEEKKDLVEVLAFMLRRVVAVSNKLFKSKKLEEFEDKLESKEVEKEAQRLERESQKIEKKIDKKEELKMSKERNILLKEKKVLLSEKLADLKKDIHELNTGKIDKMKVQEKYSELDPTKEKQKVSKEVDKGNIKTPGVNKNEVEKYSDITINKKMIKDENSLGFFTRIPYQKNKYLLLPKESTKWTSDKLNTLLSKIKSNDLIKVYNSNKEEIGEIKGEKIHHYYDKVNRKEFDKKELSFNDSNKEKDIDSIKDNEEQLASSEIDIEKSLSFFGDTKSMTFMDLASMENVDSLKEYNNFKALQKQGLVKLEKGKDLASSKINITKKGARVLSEIKKLIKIGQSPSKAVVGGIVKMVGKLMEQQVR